MFSFDMLASDIIGLQLVYLDKGHTSMVRRVVGVKVNFIVSPLRIRLSNFILLSILAGSAATVSTVKSLSGDDFPFRFINLLRRRSA